MYPMHVRFALSLLYRHLLQLKKQMKCLFFMVPLVIAMSATCCTYGAVENCSDFGVIVLCAVPFPSRI